MRLPRIPVTGELAIGQRVPLADDQAHHVLKVLRLPAGADVRLFNGEPGDWLGNLAVTGKRTASVEINDFVARATEPTLTLTLVQGLSRGQRMDYTLEKSVELGIGRIIPVIMTRSQAIPQGERLIRKAAHWQGVVASAAAQSGRTRVPAVEPLQAFSDWLGAAQCEHHPHLLLDPEAELRVRELADAPARITLLAGPEGGFTPDERALAYAGGCRGMRLGPRVLRTETAAVAALAALQAVHGDL